MKCEEVGHPSSTFEPAVASPGFRRSQRNRATLTVLALTLLVVACSDEGTGPQKAHLSESYFEQVFTGFTPQFTTTSGPTYLLGAAIKVTVPGFSPWSAARGFTDSIASPAVSTESLFRIGSISKVFTATVVLQLWEEGLIDLDAPFNDYLGLTEQTHPGIGLYGAVTVRHLLSHRTGLGYISLTSFFDDYGYESPIDQLEKLRYLLETEPEFPAGSQYAYRNANFNILGLVVEVVTGRPFHEVLRERVFSRIGLSKTYVLDYDISPSDTRIAHGYYHSFDGTHFHGSHSFASGNVVSNVEDLTTFMRALVNGDLFREQSTFSLMSSRVNIEDPYGLGLSILSIQGRVYYGHGGGVYGYNAFLQYSPTTGAILAATQSYSGVSYNCTNWYSDVFFPIMDEIRRSQEYGG